MSALLQQLHGASGPAVMLGVLLFAAIVTGGIGVLLALVEWFGRRRVPRLPDPAWAAQLRRSVRR